MSIMALTMFICVLAIFWITFVLLYPAKWKERKLIFGVNNRKEFTEGTAAGEADRIVKKTRRQALYISLTGTALAALLLLLQGMPMQTFIWSSFVLLSVCITMIPFFIGHREMMALKRSLGLVSGEGVSFVDLKMTGSIHALKGIRLLIPLAVSLAVLVFMFLADLGVIGIDVSRMGGRFAGTHIEAVYFVTGLLITFFAVLMDRMKNSVISADSDVNANYNRAKKRNWANLSVGFLWLNTSFMILVCILFIISESGMLMMVGMGLYLVALLADLAVFVHGTVKIESRYQKEVSLVPDDDEYWIGGMIYCNRKDRRILVEKRAGVGGTVNMGHPVGKFFWAIAALALAGALCSLVVIGMLEATPMRLYTKDAQLVCRQLKDDYVIPYGEIESIDWGEDTDKLMLLRSNGIGTETLLKGEFAVDGQRDCKVFISMEERNYIRIATKDGKYYYINSSDADETRRVYEELSAVVR